MKRLSKFEEFKKMYGFDSGDVKWLPEGGDLLKHVGQEMIMVEYEKNPETDSYSSTVKTVKLLWMGDYDMMTMTYGVKWSFADDPNNTVHEERIIPEGFSFDIMGQGLQDKMNKFVPFSLHAAVVEEDFYYKKVNSMWEDKKTLPFGAIRALNETKEQGKILKFAKNIIAAVKPTKEVEDGTGDLEYTDDIFIFRVGQLKLRHEGKTMWRLFITDQNGKSYSVVVENEGDEEFYELEIGGEKIGDLKLIDLGDEKTSD